MAEQKSKAHIRSVDFMRLACAAGIIVYHYSCETAGSFKPLFSHANGSWGDAIVCAFFILSGAMLYYNNPELPSLKRFYYKRFRSVFPAFYIAWFFFFMQTVFSVGRLFYAGGPWMLLPTVFGLDGYFAYLLPGNYYLTGEWFLGALILCYLLYPLLLKAFRRSAAATTAVLFLGSVLVSYTDFFVIEDIRNLISVLFVFELGMLLMRFRKQVLEKPQAAAVTAAFCLVLVFVRLPIRLTLCCQALGLCLFILLYRLGCVLMRDGSRASFRAAAANRIEGLERGGLSYTVFLVQHRIILSVLGVKDPYAPPKVLAMIALTAVLVFLYAKALLVVTQAAQNSGLFKKMDRHFL